jgi:hypothetical protein
MLCLGTALFPQPSPVEARDLIVSPETLPQLDNLAWRRGREEGQDPTATAVWQGYEDGSSRGVEFFQEVHRSRNDLFAWWAYRSTPRINYEEDFPEGVFDVDGPSGLRAEDHDVYCVDLNQAYQPGGQCGLWVYWARYGRLRVYVEAISMESNLDEDSFLQVVAAIDDSVAALVLSD